MKKIMMFIITILFILHSFNLNAQDNLSNVIVATAWSHDGTRIAAVGSSTNDDSGYFKIFDANTSDLIFELPQMGGEGFTSIAWSPNDQFLAAGRYDQTIWIIDLATGKRIIVLEGHQSTVTGVDWSPDGTKLASSGNWDLKIILWDMSTYQMIKSIEFGDPWVIAFSPNGQYIAAGGADGVYVYNATMDTDSSVMPRTYRYAEGYIGALSWSSDSRYIAFGTQTFDLVSTGHRPPAHVGILDVSSRAVIRDFESEFGTIFGIAWSPDSNLISHYNIDGQLSVRDAQTGVVLSQINDVNTFIAHQLDFSPYGGRLAYGTTFSPDALARAQPTMDNLDPAARLAAHGIAVVVPAPSLARLNTIAQFCGALPADAPPVTTATLDGWLAELDSPTRAVAVPSGCIADLRAVADALG